MASRYGGRSHGGTSSLLKSSGQKSLTRLDTRQLPEIEEVFSIPKQVADRMLFFGRVRLRDKNRLARSCGRGPTVDPGHTYGMDDKHGDGTQHDASSPGPATRSPERGHELGSPPSALGSDRAAQDALAQAVGGVNEKTRAIAGALGLIGTEDRVYAKGIFCYLFTSRLGLAGVCAVPDPLLKLELTAWFPPTLQASCATLPIRELRRIAKSLAHRIDCAVEKHIKECAALRRQLDGAEVFDPEANSRRVAAAFKSKVQQSLQSANLLHMYRRIANKVASGPQPEEQEEPLLASLPSAKFKASKVALAKSPNGGADAGQGKSPPRSRSRGAAVGAASSSPSAGGWYKGPTRMGETLAQRTTAPADIKEAAGYSSWQAKRVVKDTSMLRTNMTQASPYMLRSQTLANSILPDSGGIQCDTRRSFSPNKGSRPRPGHSRTASHSGGGRDKSSAGGGGDGAGSTRKVGFATPDTVAAPAPGAVQDGDGGTGATDGSPTQPAQAKASRKTARKRTGGASSDSKEQANGSGRPLSPHVEKHTIQRQLEFIWSTFEIPFHARMAQLIGSSSGLESALAMRQRVDALELAAHSVIHWHHIQELYEESRLRVQDEQRVQQLYAAHMPEATDEDGEVADGTNDDDGPATLKQPLVIPATTLVFLRRHDILMEDEAPPASASTPIVELERWFLWLFRRITAFTVHAMKGVARSLEPGVGAREASRILQRPHPSQRHSKRGVGSFRSRTDGDGSRDAAEAVQSAEEASGVSSQEQGFDTSLPQQLAFKGENVWAKLQHTVAKYDVDFGSGPGHTHA